MECKICDTDILEDSANHCCVANNLLHNSATNKLTCGASVSISLLSNCRDYDEVTMKCIKCMPDSYFSYKTLTPRESFCCPKDKYWDIYTSTCINISTLVVGTV